VTSPLEGEYCFAGLSFTPKNVMVTISHQTGGNDQVSQVAVPPDGLGTCPGGTQALVTIYGAASGLKATPFYVVFN
jgi:hypothetical protein